jgi:hypothetical protein
MGGISTEQRILLYLKAESKGRISRNFEARVRDVPDLMHFEFLPIGFSAYSLFF